MPEGIPMTGQPQHGRFRDRENPETMHDKPQPHPLRCDHECVCYSYLDYQSDDLDPCLAKSCEHDTRTHTSAGAQQRIEQVIKELETKRAHCHSCATRVAYTEAIALLQAGDKE